MNNPLKYLIDYRLTPHSLQVTTFGGSFVIREIPYADIQEVRRGYQWWNEHWENRLDLWSSAVSLKLNRPMLPWFVVTPEHPDVFVVELRQKMAR